MAIYTAIVRSYDRQEIKRALSGLMGPFGGFETMLRGRDGILLKPNFVVPESRQNCGVTHPDFYMAIAECLLDIGKNVCIGDSPAFGSTKMAVRLHGVMGECRQKGINVLTFKKQELYEGVAGSKQYAELSIASELRQFDAIINLPKLKVHQQFVFTGATKNLYGCVSGRSKAYRHFTSQNDDQLFAGMILANARKADPVLNIGDGIIAMHKNGPRGGEPYPLHRIIVSDSFLEHDWFFCRLIGLPPERAPLFQILTETETGRLEEACRDSLSSNDFAVARGFERAPEAPIRFSALHMIRAMWRSLTKDA